jgi:glutathione S-transferase
MNWRVMAAWPRAGSSTEKIRYGFAVGAPPSGSGFSDRRLNGSDVLEKYPNLFAYVARGEARPAYKRAFDAQLAVFTGKPPASR